MAGKSAAVTWTLSRLRDRPNIRVSRNRAGPSDTITMTVAPSATPHAPAPAAMPTAATAHRLAAVVRPRTLTPYLRIAPAPRKPIPDTICAATRPWSPPGPAKA